MTQLERNIMQTAFKLEMDAECTGCGVAMELADYRASLEQAILSSEPVQQVVVSLCMICRQLEKEGV